MRPREARGTASIAFTTILLIVACASGPNIRHKHEYTLSPGQEYHAGLAKALLIPMDYTNEKPVKGLDIANDRITAIIVSHLESKGIKVEKAAPGQFKRIADEAFETVREERMSGASGVVSSEVDFGDVVPAIVDELEDKPDLVIATNVVMRDATYQGTRTIVWDGVHRRETVYGARMSGGVPAASLQVSVHTRDGTAVFSGFGGLEPVFKLSGNGYVQREDLFDDERNLREGTCIAFYPYFGTEEYCSR